MAATGSQRWSARVTTGKASAASSSTTSSEAGAKILKPAAKLEWGGYGGTFADPDGYIWSIGYSAQGEDQPYAE
jgi:uncharacterized protein